MRSAILALSQYLQYKLGYVASATKMEPEKEQKAEQ